MTWIDVYNSDPRTVLTRGADKGVIIAPLDIRRNDDQRMNDANENQQAKTVFYVDQFLLCSY